MYLKHYTLIIETVLSFQAHMEHSQKLIVGTSLVAQWLRIHLPMQRTWVQALVREDTTCHRATKPVHHNY